MNNSFNLDNTQRGLLTGVILSFAYFLAHTIHRINKAKEAKSAPVIDPSFSTGTPALVPLPAVTDSNGRFITPITPQKLIDLFKGRTEFQASQQLQPYLGKWMRVAGKVIEVKEEYDFIRLELSVPGSIIVCADYNTKIWADTLRLLNPDDDVVVVGQIRGAYNSHSFRNVYLATCELMN